MQPHTIASYDTDLKALDELVGDMASRAEASLRDAANALFGGDVQLAQRVLAADAALDRIGDHATNIAETTHYMITGDMLSTDRPKADESSGVDPSWEPRKS